LPNRRAFDTGAPAIYAADQSLRRPTTFLLCDLDHFKRMNDRFGHIAGDEILKELAHILRAQTRQGDQLYRWGGEEFAVLLPDTTEAEALAIAHRIRRAVAEAPVTIRKAAGGGTIRLNTTGQPHCSVSIGLAPSSATGPDLDELFLLADQALGRAKDGGRNRVVTASSSQYPGNVCHV
jgi:two-component system cell cycle response regulator